jgi:hypothetical protein
MEPELELVMFSLFYLSLWLTCKNIILYWSGATLFRRVHWHCGARRTESPQRIQVWPTLFLLRLKKPVVGINGPLSVAAMGNTQERGACCLPWCHLIMYSEPIRTLIRQRTNNQVIQGTHKTKFPQNQWTNKEEDNWTKIEVFQRKKSKWPKNMRKCSPSLTILEMKIKTTLKISPHSF